MPLTRGDGESGGDPGQGSCQDRDSQLGQVHAAQPDARDGHCEADDRPPREHEPDGRESRTPGGPPAERASCHRDQDSDDEHHRVAFLDPGPLTERQPDAAGLNHVAFTFGGLDDLIANYERLKKLGINPHRCVNHGVTTSMYYHDPDHNQVELLVDNFATAVEGKAYMRRRSTADKNPVGVGYDPEELAQRVRNGLRVEELVAIN